MPQNEHSDDKSSDDTTEDSGLQEVSSRCRECGNSWLDINEAGTLRIVRCPFCHGTRVERKIA